MKHNVDMYNKYVDTYVDKYVDMYTYKNIIYVYTYIAKYCPMSRNVKYTLCTHSCL